MVHTGHINWLDCPRCNKSTLYTFHLIVYYTYFECMATRMLEKPIISSATYCYQQQSLKVVRKYKVTACYVPLFSGYRVI